MQLSQEIFNILKGANIKLKLFDPMGNKTLDPELSARFYAYDNDFLVTIREEEDGVELVVQAGASFNFNEHKDLLNSIKKAGHNAMAEYNIRKFDKNIELKDFAHDVVKEDEEIRRLKELSGIKEADRSDVTHAQLVPHIKNVKAAMIRHAQEDPSEANEFIEHLDDMMQVGDVEVVDMMQPDWMDTEARDSLISYFKVSISQDPALYNMIFPGEDIKWDQGEYKDMFEAEKRWKQTSMSPEEAIEKYGKENVKVKKGALRNGDDMVEVFVESMNEGGNSVEAFMAHVVDHAKEIQADNYRMTDSSYYEFTDEIDTDDEEFMSMPQVQAILKAIPHVDMENTDIKHAIDVLASGELLEAETESMNEGGNDVAELVGDVHYHNNHYDRDERKSEMQEDAAKLVMAAKSTGDEDIIASAESVEHLCHHYDYDEAKDMLNNKLQELNQLVGGNELEVEESYSPGDEYADSEGMVSNCCGAPMMDYNDGHGRCSDCKEMAAGETDEEYYESAEIRRLKDLIRY